MGQDKAVTPLPGREITMIDAVLAAAQKLVGDVMVVSPPRAGYAREGVRLIPDAEGPPGPLRGVAAALAAAHEDRCLILACDLPCVSPALLRFIASFADQAEAIIPVTSGSSRQGGDRIYQTLHAVYSRSCLPVIRRQLRSGDPHTTRFLDEVDVMFLTEERLRQIDPQLRSFSNVNTPAELSRLKV